MYDRPENYLSFKVLIDALNDPIIFVLLLFTVDSDRESGFEGAGTGAPFLALLNGPALVLRLLLEFADADLALRNISLQVQRLATALSPLALPLVRWLLAHLLDVACDLNFLRLAVVVILCVARLVVLLLGPVDTLFSTRVSVLLLSSCGVSQKLALVGSGRRTVHPVDEVSAHRHNQLLLVHDHVFQFVDYGSKLLSDFLLKLSPVEAAALFKILADLLEIVLG